MNVVDVIKEVVSLAAGVPQEKLSESQSLLCDLGIAGDDAEELFDCLAQTFRIDMEEFFFVEHFPAEATADMQWFMARRNYLNSTNRTVRFFHYLDGLFWGVFCRKKEYKPITIYDLICVAEARRWKAGERVV